jgi:hypothetical protein
MNKRLFLTTSAALAIATTAFAQTNPPTSTSTANPPSTQGQTSSTPTTSPATPAPQTSAQTSSPSPANSAQTSTPSQTNSAQTSSPPPTNSAQAPAPSAGSQTTAAQPTTPNSGTAASQAPAANTASGQTQPAAPATAQSQPATPPATGTSQAQQAPNAAGATNTAQQPSASDNINASVNINDQQRTRISQSIAHLNVKPISNVNFSVSVGTVVPRDIRLSPLPAEVVEVVPQYRGYNFVVVRDEIVIVEPSSYKIVAVLPQSGRATAAAPARTEQRKVTFSDRDREVIRKHAKARTVERQTTGSTVRTEIRTGGRVPDDVEIEAFPDEVYREAPALREYRYINRDSRTYVVEPHERRIIEEID